jgi:hypothetical protein
VQLLEWYNLIFVAPIALAAIYLILSSMGIGGETGHDLGHDVSVDHDITVDHDLAVEHDVALEHDISVEHDVAAEHDLGADHGAVAGHEAPTGLEHEVHGEHMVEHHETSLLLRGLTVLGFGKIPLSLLVTSLMVLFGVSGLAANTVFGYLLPFKWAPVVYVWPSLGFAVLVGLSLTGVTARGLARLMPTSETYAVLPEELVGLVGIAVYGLREGQKAEVHVKDGAGDWHSIAGQPVIGDIAKDQEVVLVRYHRDGDYYDVSVLPV